MSFLNQQWKTSEWVLLFGLGMRIENVLQLSPTFNVQLKSLLLARLIPKIYEHWTFCTTPEFLHTSGKIILDWVESKLYFFSWLLCNFMLVNMVFGHVGCSWYFAIWCSWYFAIQCILNLTLCVWHMGWPMQNVIYLVFGVWYLIFGILYLVFGVWYLVFDI